MFNLNRQHEKSETLMFQDNNDCMTHEEAEEAETEELVVENHHWIYASSHFSKSMADVSVDKIGKWMVFCDASSIERKWEQVCVAIELKILWSAKRSVQAKKDEFVIIIYTQNYTELLNVIQTLDYLEATGIKDKKKVIYYKTDEQTHQGIYSGDVVRSWVYSSKTIHQLALSSSSSLDVTPQETIVPKLRLQLMPANSWLKDLNQILTLNAIQLLQSALVQGNHFCNACDCNDHKVLRHSPLWFFDETQKVQRLEGMEILCQSCFDVKNIQFFEAIIGKKDYLKQINQWDEVKFFKYVENYANLWCKLSQVRWNVDIGWLTSQGYSLLNMRTLPAAHYVVSELFNAVLYSKLEKIAELLPLVKTKTGICEKNLQGENMLCVAVRNKRKDILEILLKNMLAKKHLLNQGWQGKPTLHYAVESKDIELINQLLNAGADPNALDKFKRSILHVAAKEKNHVISQIILSLFPDIYMKIDRFLRRPSDYAVADFASFDKNNNNELKMLELFVNPFQEIDFLYQDIYGKTILHHAVTGLSVNALEILLNRGAKRIINVIDNYGKTALHIAAILGLAETLKLLLKYEADPNIISLNGNTAIMEAYLCDKIGSTMAQSIFYNSKNNEYKKQKLNDFELNIASTEEQSEKSVTIPGVYSCSSSNIFWQVQEGVNVNVLASKNNKDMSVKPGNVHEISRTTCH